MAQLTRSAAFPSKEYLFIAAGGVENQIQATPGYDADYTAMTPQATAGGGGASNVAVYAAFRILTGTTDSFVVGSCNFAGDMVTTFIALEEAGATAYALDLAAGSYSISGQALSPLAGRALNLEAGALAITGAALTVAKGYGLNLESSTYNIQRRSTHTTSGTRSKPYSRKLCS